MKKIKGLSLVLALCMLLSVFTIAATADETAETVTIKKGQHVKYSVSLQMQQKFGGIDGRFFFDASKFGLLVETREDDIIIDPETGEKLFSDYHDYYSLSFPGAGLNNGTRDGSNDPGLEEAAGVNVVTNYGVFVEDGEVWWNYLASSGVVDGEVVGLDYSQETDLMVAVLEAREDITCTRDELNDYLRFDYAEILDVNMEELDFFGDANGKIDIEILDAPVETPETDSDVVSDTEELAPEN